MFRRLHCEKSQLGAYAGLSDANGRPYSGNVFNSLFTPAWAMGRG